MGGGLGGGGGGGRTKYPKKFRASLRSAQFF
jgi:hypothetical protein